MKNKLKTCPFCDELPEKATMETPRGIIYFLECTNDECPAHSVSVCGDHFEQSAINKWNTRPTRPSLEPFGKPRELDEKKIANIIYIQDYPTALKDKGQYYRQYREYGKAIISAYNSGKLWKDGE